MSEYNEEWEGMDLASLAKTMIQVKDELEEAKQIQAAAQKKFDALRKFVIPTKMEDMGIQSVNITGVGRLSLRAEMYAGFQPGMQDDAITWLEQHGHGDLVKETVHNSTLKAFLKEQLREGEILPDELFKQEPYMMATITKK